MLKTEWSVRAIVLPTTSVTKVFTNEQTLNWIKVSLKVLNPSAWAKTLTLHICAADEVPWNNNRILAAHSFPENATSPVELFVDAPIVMSGKDSLYAVWSAAWLVVHIMWKTDAV